ncbi:hypothetical protein A8B98_16830 [Hymenobacter sp. UV11]|nr:hypothetical protein A8B98_16830 [Hymenobacter sp. UV11]
MAAVKASLFEKPTPNYALVAMLALIGGATFVFGSNMVPGIATHVVMLLTMLAASRIFSPRLLRSFWYVAVGLIAFVLVLDVAIVVAA